MMKQALRTTRELFCAGGAPRAQSLTCAASRGVFEETPDLGDEIYLGRVQAFSARGLQIFSAMLRLWFVLLAARPQFLPPRVAA